MSMSWMVKAFNLKVGSSARKLVLIKLADNANDAGVCWPSYQHIADQCELSRRTAIAHINALEAMGLVSITHRKGEKGNGTNIYQLHFSGGEKIAPPDIAGAAGGENISPLESDAPITGGEISAPLEDTGVSDGEGFAPPSESISPPSAAFAPDGEISAPPPSENAAPRTSHSFEPVNEPSSNTAAADDSHIELFEKDHLVCTDHFEMHEHWQPSNRLHEMCALQQIDLSVFDEDEQSDLLGQFKNFWMFDRQGSMKNAGGWDAAFVKHLKFHQLKKHHGTPVASSGKQATRAAVTASVMNISDTDW